MSTPSALRAHRAIGSLFFSVFGGAWVGAWALKSVGLRSWMGVPILLGTLMLLGAALRQYLANRSALAAESETPERRRASWIFNLVKAGQWIAVLIAVNVVNNPGHPEWVIPAFIFIVGVHFLPLASVFKARRHLLTGVALMAVALIYPQVAPQGAASPVGCLGAGVILWAAALAGVWPDGQGA
ncbi:MAG TPA: hypothetical protein VJ623_13680 [Holophagaceae bacterium]|nr:hypothetical protein [Holophagaceae bacterium]